MPKETIVDTRENKTDDDQLIEEARERFDWSATEEAHNRKEAIDDLWFHEGSGQWPSDHRNCGACRHPWHTDKCAPQ